MVDLLCCSRYFALNVWGYLSPSREGSLQINADFFWHFYFDGSSLFLNDTPHLQQPLNGWGWRTWCKSYAIAFTDLNKRIRQHYHHHWNPMYYSREEQCFHLPSSTAPESCHICAKAHWSSSDGSYLTMTLFFFFTLICHLSVVSQNLPVRLDYASMPLFGQREELQWADAGVMGSGAVSLTHAKGN